MPHWRPYIFPEWSKVAFLAVIFVAMTHWLSTPIGRNDINKFIGGLRKSYDFFLFIFWDQLRLLRTMKTECDTHFNNIVGQFYYQIFFSPPYTLREKKVLLLLTFHIHQCKLDECSIDSKKKRCLAAHCILVCGCCWADVFRLADVIWPTATA